jgi:hypothetical protein
VSCFLRQQDKPLKNRRKLKLSSLSFRGTRNVSSAELYLTRYSHNALLPSSAGQWGGFLPRIALMLRILFVIIRIIRKICGYFFLQERNVMSCFLRQQDNVVIFLPRISLMLRILFVIIRIIRKICGYFT